MQAVPIIFAAALAILTIVLVVVGIQVVLTMTAIRKTLKKVNLTVEKSGLTPEVVEAVRDINTQMSDALGAKTAVDHRYNHKKRPYSRKGNPSQFKGV